jgi:hypothetical protein
MCPSATSSLALRRTSGPRRNSLSRWGKRQGVNSGPLCVPGVGVVWFRGFRG